MTKKPIKTRKTAIVAGNLRQAQDWAIKKGLARSEWFFVEKQERLLGKKFVDIVYVGTYYERNDLREIEARVRLLDLAGDL